MSDRRRDNLMLHGLALLAARFLAYFRSRGARAFRNQGVNQHAYDGILLCLAIAVHNLEQAAAWLIEAPRRSR